MSPQQAGHAPGKGSRPCANALVSGGARLLLLAVMPVAPEFLVDFLIGGTQKGGTTALTHFLGQHPEVCLPAGKEAHFFDRPAYPDGADRAEVARRYRAKFPDMLRGRIVGEATPIYMFLPFVPERVHRYNPAMKWIVLLREPVARAVSHYRMSRARGREWLPPELAFRAERFRLWRDGRRPVTSTSSWRHHSYVRRGFYSEQLARIGRYFPAGQILVLTAENLRRRHEETLREAYAFLGITVPAVLPVAEEVFATPKARPVSERTRAWLRTRYAPEVARLEALLGRRLDEWK